MHPHASQPENPPPTAIPLATFAPPVPGPMSRTLNLGPKLKFALVAALFVGSLLCCFVTTWYTASERAARLERERITQELKGDFAAGTQVAKSAETAQPKKAVYDKETKADDEPPKNVHDDTVKSSEVYTREEFRELVKDKGTDAVIAAVGRPDKSEESFYKAKNPGSGLLENFPIMFWTFENRTRDPFTGKIDSRAIIEFRGDANKGVRSVYVVRFQQ